MLSFTKQCANYFILMGAVTESVQSIIKFILAYIIFIINIYFYRTKKIDLYISKKLLLKEKIDFYFF